MKAKRLLTDMHTCFRLDKENGFEWIGEYDISADDLLSGNNRGQKIKEAKEFLLEILADGAVEQNVILKEAETVGLKGRHSGMRRRLLASSR